MTTQVRLVKTGGVASTLDLYGGTDEIKIVDWIPGVATQSPQGFYGDIAETITVKVSASDHDDLASITASIVKKLEDAQAYDRNPVSVYPVYLQDRLRTENNAGSAVRQALVRRGAVQPLYPTHGYAAEDHNAIPRLQIGLVRAPFWEGSAACTYTGACMSGAASGEDMAATVVVRGDVPARISQVEMLPAGCDTTLTTVWVGFKTDIVSGVVGNRNSFVPVWECEYGQAGSDSVRYSDETILASFSPTGDGSGIRVDFTASATSTMVDRVTIRAASVIGDSVLCKAARGDYLALLRAYVTVAPMNNVRTWVRLRAGYSESGVWQTGDRVEINDQASLQHWEMGIFSIPDIRTDNDLRDFSFRIEAEREKDQTGLLYLDCLSLIPIDSGLLKVASGNILEVDELTRRKTVVYTEPNEEISGANLYTDISDNDPTNVKRSTPEMIPVGWSLPSGCTRMIAAWQRDGKSVLTDKIKFTLSYYPRWKLLRGAE